MNTVSPAKQSIGVRRSWSTRDIVIASVIAVACGLVFWLWSAAIYPLATTAFALAPEFAPIFGGGWLIAGVLGGLVVRKPGAALYCEILGAIIEGLLGTHFGWTVVISGIAQGLGTEIIFALFLYRHWNLAVATLAGAASGIMMGINEIVMYYAAELSPAKMVIYTLSAAVSGAMIAGVLSWIAVKALAQTGVITGPRSNVARQSA